MIVPRFLAGCFFFSFFLHLPLQAEPSLLEKRKGHKTELIEKKNDDTPPPQPPEEVFDLIKYPAPTGELSAYLSKESESKEPGPAIIWLTGGFPVSSPGEYLWMETSIDNEQSARIYRLKGITMMFPHLRGRSGSPGQIENFYGEVNDVISALDYLEKLKRVDPRRIYLGGHSTGGTLALLVAAATDRFAGVISLGPTSDHYGKDGMVYKWNAKERDFRSPIKHLASIKSPTIIAEGEHGNKGALLELRKAGEKNPNITTAVIKDGDHFQIIHPLNNMIADAILTSKEGNLEIEQDVLENCYATHSNQKREAQDLETLAHIRSNGTDIKSSQTLTFFVVPITGSDRYFRFKITGP